MTNDAISSRVRKHLAVLWIGAALGIAAELLLLGHTEDPWQIAPLAVLGAGLVTLTWALVSRRTAAVRTFQGLMLATVASAIAGLWLHGVANVEFEREISPDLAGWALLWKSFHGTAPPALAPGVMAVLGWIGLLWAHRHPAFDNPSAIADLTQGEPRS